MTPEALSSLPWPNHGRIPVSIGIPRRRDGIPKGVLEPIPVRQKRRRSNDSAAISDTTLSQRLLRRSERCWDCCYDITQRGHLKQCFLRQFPGYVDKTKASPSSSEHADFGGVQDPGPEPTGKAISIPLGADPCEISTYQANLPDLALVPVSARLVEENGLILEFSVR